MAKGTNRMNVTVATSKQQVSKILMGQILAGVKNAVEYNIDLIKDSVEYKILQSNADNRKIAGWRTDSFAFKFEYGRRHGSIRVSYMNSDGLQSATFSSDEWSCFTDYMISRIDRIISEQRAKNREKAQKIAAILEERKQRAFEQAVRAQVEKVLKEQQSQHTNSSVEFDGLDDFKTI